VAQQVFQPQQAPQGAPPQGAPPPMGAPPMGAPPMGAPPPPQPPGMAMGGLMDLSVPDDMFSEPVADAENFAGGGLVAFAMGGEVYRTGEGYVYADGSPAPTPKPGTVVMRGAKPLFGGDYIPSGETTVVPGGPPTRERGSNRPVRQYGAGERMPFGESRVGRAVGDVFNTLSNRTPEAQRAFTQQQREQAASRREREERAVAQARYEYDLGVFNTLGGKKPTPPAPALAPSSTPRPAAATPPPAPFRQQDSRSEVTRPTPAPAPRPAAALPSPRAAMAAPTAPRGLAELAATQGAAPRPAATPGAPGAPPAPQAPAGPTGLEGNMELLRRLMGPQAATPERDKEAAMMRQQMSPEAMAAQKKQDMWQALAQFGFGMAGTNSPSFLQAAGQAGAATVPAMAAMAKERKATEREARKWLVDNENMTNAEARALKAQEITFAQAREAVEENRRQFDANFGLEEEKFKYTKQRDIAERADRRRGSGGIGAPDFPGGMDGYRLERFYKAEMAKVPQLLAKNPRIKAEYDANPQAWMARYSADAERRALLSVEEQKGDGERPRYRGSPTPSGGSRPPLSSFGG
jgi:hypothetical protein